MTSAHERGNVAETDVASPAEAGEPSPAASDDRNAAARKRLGKILDNRWAVLSLIFFAMMALGIPLIWKSRAFSPAGKVFWTIAALVYTAVVFWLFYLVMWWTYRSIATSLGYG
ncbi:MAG: hypothetical protein RIC55_08535 [Pirellulaceae bacterium]